MAMTDADSTRDLDSGATGTGRKRRKDAGRLKIDLTGKRFDRWTVEAFVRFSPKKEAIWLCRCDCGEHREVLGRSLNSGHSKSCGCLKRDVKRATKGKPLYDLTGRRFERLVAKSLTQERKGSQLKWLCQCDCGEVVKVLGSYLREGITKSCGCLQREMGGVCNQTHGMSGTSEFNIWAAMKQRCYDPNNAAYKNYGARGITICAEWRSSFEAFYRDMGPRPSLSHSIDRIDNDLGYFPENCRWATHKEQSRNTRRTIYLTINGIAKPAATWAEKNGIEVDAALQRLRMGWPPERAVSEPIDTRFGRRKENSKRALARKRAKSAAAN